MSSVMDSIHSDPAQFSGTTASPQAANFKLKRLGSRPLIFQGSELAMAMSYMPNFPYWYEINIYRTLNQRFVTAVRLFYQDEHTQDSMRAWENDSIDDAIEKLIRYDPAYDVSLSLEAELSGTPPAVIAAQAITLQVRISEARHHYQSLVGEFLYDLENGQ